MKSPIRVLVTGATGLVGSRLVAALRERGDTVLALSRRPGPNTILGDPAQSGPWLDVVDGCDSIVHLAGENIFAKRWSDAFLAKIRDSRIESTKLIAERLAKKANRNVVFVSCSAVGYYGDRGDEPVSENDAPGADFMAGVCRDWEAAADPARKAGIRVVHPRLGIVLDPAGGALPNLVRPFRLFVGGRIGSGKQFVSWIHHSDLTRLLLFAIEGPALSGPFNATSPNPVTNADLGRTIARVIGRPHWLPTPRFALRLALGKIAGILVTGQRAIPTAALRAGFEFRFPELESALRDLLGYNGGNPDSPKSSR